MAEAGPRIRLLTAADVPAAQRLREQAGWNQSDDDWRRLLVWEPAGCWAADQDGQVVGTATVTTYGQRIAWVGMVLVDVDRRGQGIGRALLEHALGYLERRGIETVALDSTPAGQPLYRRLGFVEAFELARWRGPVRSPIEPPRPPAEPPRPPAAAGALTIRPFAAMDLAAVTSYDRRAFGTDRGHVLEALRAGFPAGGFLAERAGVLAGYVLSRPGATAWHLGPLVADDPAASERLAWAALAAQAGQPAVMDVVLPNQGAVRLAGSLGLRAVRPFIRMVRGAPPPEVDADRVYTSAGPELG